MLTDIVALIPAYNPDEGLVQLIKALREDFPQIIVVDDGCDDAYEGVFSSIEDDVVLLRHETNRGKGRALRTGFSYVLEHCPQARGVVTLDADGQHTVTDVRRCCERFLEDTSAAVFGCRDFASNTRIPARSRYGNRLTSRLMRYLCDIRLSDTQTGLRVLSVAYLQELVDTSGERYEYEMNMIFRLKELGVALVEVPIEVIYIENNASSHFHPLVDSFKIYRVFLRFCLSSAGSFVVDIVIFTILRLLLVGYMPQHYIEVSTWGARVVSGVFNYSINRRVFRGKQRSPGSAWRYLLLWFVQMMLSAYCVKYLVLWIGGDETLTKVAVDVLLFLGSYKVQQLWVFQKRDP